MLRPSLDRDGDGRWSCPFYHFELPMSGIIYVTFFSLVASPNCYIFTHQFISKYKLTILSVQISRTFYDVIDLGV